MNKQSGFTLIELVVFIVVSGLLMGTILLGVNAALNKTPQVHEQWVAINTASGCMETLLEQRRLSGYSVFSCPSTPSTSACVLPSGYTLSASVSCTTWDSDTNYKTMTVSVGGLADASLSTQIGNF